MAFCTNCGLALVDGAKFCMVCGTAVNVENTATQRKTVYEEQTQKKTSTKRLTCEMCGSIDLMKQDGVFVCQDCGCKYSVEEARKMMTGGTVRINDTVKIDNSDKIETYRKIAINAYNSRNTSEAYTYFLKILEIAPTDYQSIFYKGMCQGWETTIARPRVGEAVAAYYQAVQHIPNEIAHSVKVIYIGDLIRLMTAWFDKVSDRYFNVEDFYQSNKSIIYDYRGVGEGIIKYIDGFLGVVVNSESAALIESVGDLYCSACEAVCNHDLIYLDYSKSRVLFSGLSSQDKQPFLRKYDTMIFEVRKYNPTFKVPESEHYVIERMSPPTSVGVHNLQRSQKNYQMCLEADREINQRLQKYNAEVAQRKKKERIEKYWSEHISEKRQYEARLTSIDSELRALRIQDNPFMERIAEIQKELSQQLPAEGQLAMLKNQQNYLYEQKSKLGLFAGKQKKELQAQIDSLQVQINNTDAAVKRTRKEIQDYVSAKVSEVEAERKPITVKISALEGEKNRINYELTRER